MISWKIVTINQDKSLQRRGFLGKDQEFDSKHIKIEMPIKDLSRDVEETDVIEI